MLYKTNYYIFTDSAPRLSQSSSRNVCVLCVVCRPLAMQLYSKDFLYPPSQESKVCKKKIDGKFFFF